MKVAFVAGFFEPVRRALHERFAKQLEVSSLIWIQQVGAGRELDLGMLGSELHRQLANGAKQVLVLVALLRGKEWVEHSVRAIITQAKSQYSGDIDIELSFERTAASAELVLERIVAFTLPEPSEVSVELLRRRLAGEKVLCVVLDGRTGFCESMCRAGFPQEALDEFFVEMVVPGGRNSNLMDNLYHKADTHRHILYAWMGLRHMPSKVKKRYTGAMFIGPTTKDVVSLFKRWLLEQ